MMAAPRHKYYERWTNLKTQRDNFSPLWRDLSDFFLPRAGRFDLTDRDRVKSNRKQLIDNTPTQALRVLRAGLTSGSSSPARPWFRLSTGDDDLDGYHAVRVWLDDVRTIMLSVFARSNTYRALPTYYLELGLFGTAAGIVADNFERVHHHHNFTAGQYALATDNEGRVDTLYREFNMTVGEIVKEFGYKACSHSVKTLYDNSHLEAQRPVLQAVEPRIDRDPRVRDVRNAPWASVYFERDGVPDQYLRESGFFENRVLAPRWEVIANDVYGYSPAEEALGDSKQLQQMQLRHSQAIDYMTMPPLGVPGTSSGRMLDILPGGVNFLDGVTGKVESLFDVRLDLNYLLQDIRDVRERINSAFHADLFLMISQLDTTGHTATEIAQRYEEKLLMLGPVLERLHSELLSPYIELTFGDLMRGGMLPPPPEELDQRPLNVEFISALAQAQRAVGTAGVDRFVSNIGVVASFKPDVLDKFDADRWAEAYADTLGVDPDLIVANDKVALIRQERAAAQQAAEQQAALAQTAETAAKMGATQTQGGNSDALNDVLGLYTGYQSPPAYAY